MHKIFIHDAPHTMTGSVDVFNPAKPAGFQSHTHQRLVDYSGRPTTLGDKNFSGCHEIS
jgi:hypothetical protein